MDFTKSPYGLPESLPNARKVNKILEESYKLQKQIGLSNACGLVNIILQQGLEAVGIKSEVKHGSVKAPGIRVQHIWLTMHGYIVDNTYNHLFAMVEGDKSSLQYEGVVPSENIEDIFLGDEDTRKMGLENRQCSPKGFRWMLENEGKFITLSRNYIYIKSYIHQFAQFLDKEYSVKHFPANYANEVCWKCGDGADTLKTCSKCKVAKYCNKTCQRTDWRTLHQDMCIPPEI